MNLYKKVSTRFVGKVDGTNALIGLTDRAGQLSAYVCDSVQLAVWLSGEVSGSTPTAANGPAALEGNRSGDDVIGQVTLPDGSVHAFTATKTTDPSTVGDPVGLGAFLPAARPDLEDNRKPGD